MRGEKIERLVGTMIDGKPVLVKVTSRPRHWRDRPSKPRLFVHGTAVDPSWELPAYGSKRGDGTDEDRAWRRFNREETRLRKIVAKAIGVEGKFSRNAGCTCGCSPGFVVERGIRRFWDAWATAEPLKL